MVVRPDQVELRYAAMGSDETRQAIVAVQVSDMAFAAVARPVGSGWERIAQFGCWCKYDLERFLDEFVTLVRAPDPNALRWELVVRASGGGSGLYEQYEAHFRYFNGEIREVISFGSRLVRASTGPEYQVEVERRWFHGDNNPYNPGVTMVEGHAVLRAEAVPPLELGVYDSIRDLESRQLGPLACRQFKWNEKVFRYESAGDTHPCQARAR